MDYKLDSRKDILDGISKMVGSASDLNEKMKDSIIMGVDPESPYGKVCCNFYKSMEKFVEETVSRLNE